MFREWSLETLEVGGPSGAPWQYGRSVLTGQWEYNDRRNERHYASIATNRGGTWKVLAQQVTPNK